MSKPRFITLHTVGFKGRPIDIKDIEMWHRDQGWPHVGYHFYIKYNGIIQKGIDIEKRGIHVRNNNTGNIGICFEGNGDLEPITPHQRVSMRYLINRGLRKEYNIPIKNIRGHNEWPNQNRTCPGSKIDMNEIRDYLKRREHINIKL